MPCVKTKGSDPLFCPQGTTHANQLQFARGITRRKATTLPAKREDRELKLGTKLSRRRRRWLMQTRLVRTQVHRGKLCKR